MFNVGFYIILFYFGFKSFFFNNSHLLLSLMSLEFLGLNFMFLVLMILSAYSYDSMMIVYFMIILVCEAAMGLMLITLVVRSHGSDYLKSYSLFQC